MAASAVSVVTQHPPNPPGQPLNTCCDGFLLLNNKKVQLRLGYLFLIPKLVVDGRFLQRLDFDFLRGRPV